MQAKHYHRDTVTTNMATRHSRWDSM